MGNKSRIQKVSKVIKIIFTIAFLAAPIINALFWIFCTTNPIDSEKAIINADKTGISFDLSMEATFIPDGNSDGNQILSTQQRILGFTATLLPLCITMIGLYLLIKLFSLYQQGKIFTKENVTCYRNLGLILVSKMFVQIFYSALLSFLMTFNNPPGQRFISVGAGSIDITVLFFGIIVLVISWVMDEARNIEEEQGLTV